MSILKRLQIHRLWFTLLCSACTFESSATRPSSSPDTAPNRKSNNDKWKPPAGGTTRQTHADAAEDARDAATPASASNQGQSAAATPAARRPPATPSPAASQSPRTPPPLAGESARPASKHEAGDRAEPAGEPEAGGWADRAGQPEENSAGAGSSAGAAGSGAGNSRQSLIDAALEALGGALDGGVEPWSNGGQPGGRLSAEFVKSVLYSVIGTGVCFVQVPACVQLCFAIATDCSPCAEDPECAEALKSVCGPLEICAVSYP